MREVIVTASELSRARYELELFLLGGEFDLYEDERRIATVERDGATAEVSFGKLIFSCWGEGWARSWRVLKCELMPERLRLQCARQMGRSLCAVELRRGLTTGEIAGHRMPDGSPPLGHVGLWAIPLFRAGRLCALRAGRIVCGV